MGFAPQQGGGTNMRDDQEDFQQEQQNSQQTDPDLKAAPYVRLLVKLGYEFQGHDQDLGGGKIGSTFQGPDGDMIMVKPDGSWVRFGPGSQRSQGPDVNSLGQQLVRGALQEGDDTNHHAALRQAGYSKIHTDAGGNTYYKHPQTGKTVHVGKDGQWGSSVGTGKGAGKLREFLGNEALDAQDPAMMQINLKKQQMKQQAGQGGDSMRMRSGTRGQGSTRGGSMRFAGTPEGATKGWDTRGRGRRHEDEPFEHPQHGQFKHVMSSRAGDTSYHRFSSPDGTKVSYHQNYPHSTGSVFENGHQIHDGTPNSAEAFMKDKYGIDH